MLKTSLAYQGKVEDKNTCLYMLVVIYTVIIDW